MIPNILVALMLIVVVFIFIVTFQPNDFRIVRSATMSALPVAIFTQVNDFRKWEAWSPWAKLDPQVKNTYAGPAAGVGAAFAWSGNNKVGEGRMTITESSPYELVRIKLEFLRPFKATNTAEFTFKSEGNRTTVTWSMFGKNNFMGKAMGLIMNFDKTAGRDFEKGLAKLKSVAETAGWK